MSDTTEDSGVLHGRQLPAPEFYPSSGLTYSNTWEHPLKRGVIQTIEWLSGKHIIIRMLREFERTWPESDKHLWRHALEIMNVEVATPAAEVAHIPETGPLIVVANHPHGLVDGMVLGDLIGRRRDDYKILTRSLLMNVHQDAGRYLIPVPFPHQPDAQEQMLAMRRASLDHLSAGGAIALFPSGVVAASDRAFGPVVEAEWNVFTAKLIRLSGATVVPLYFPGANSRAYQVANQLSATLRQSLLLSEIVKARNSQQRPVIGPPFDPAEIAERIREPRAFMAWLRSETLGLSIA